MDFNNNKKISLQQSAFSYDGMGNRLQKTENGIVTRYIYDAAGIKHAFYWIPYILSLGNDKYNPDSPDGPFRAQYLEMLEEERNLKSWTEIQQSRGSSNSK